MKQKLLLLDSLGALSSVLFLVAIGQYEQFFGINKEIIQLLVPIPILFSVYSFLSYYFSNTKWPLFLKIIAVANILYCLVTLCILFIFFKQLSLLGISYFSIEIAVIFTLALYELKIAQIHTTQTRRQS
ncbi:hypothetical protein [Flavobacterium sp. H122]|uniref:hypothetical protein n=1 Tax=Flavobacterium sp. H122 TaxID=2529860 RepID=UPI0010AAF8E1|nr:hypothetical protein [Flavobacterium sp. H122]